MVPLINPAVEPFTAPKIKGAIFEDSFDRCANGLLDKVVSAEWSVVNGSSLGILGYWGLYANYSSTGRLYLPRNYRDFAISGENFGYPGAAATEPNWFIYFRYDFTANSGYYAMYHQDSNGIYVRRVDAGTETTLAIVSYPAVRTPGALLQVEARGKQITVYHNGRKIVTVNDGTYAEGNVGLRMYRAGFRWVRVVEL